MADEMEIIISAVDNASEAFKSVISSTNDMSSEVENAMSSASDSMSEMESTGGVATANIVEEFDEMGNVVRTVNLSTIRDGMVVSEYVTKTEAEAKALEDVEETQAEAVEENK